MSLYVTNTTCWRSWWWSKYACKDPCERTMSVTLGGCSRNEQPCLLQRGNGVPMSHDGASCPVFVNELCMTIHMSLLRSFVKDLSGGRWELFCFNELVATFSRSHLAHVRLPSPVFTYGLAGMLQSTEFVGFQSCPRTARSEVTEKHALKCPMPTPSVCIDGPLSRAGFTTCT